MPTFTKTRGWPTAGGRLIGCGPQPFASGRCSGRLTCTCSCGRRNSARQERRILTSRSTSIRPSNGWRQNSVWRSFRARGCCPASGWPTGGTTRRQNEKTAMCGVGCRQSNASSQSTSPATRPRSRRLSAGTSMSGCFEPRPPGGGSWRTAKKMLPSTKLPSVAGWNASARDPKAPRSTPGRFICCGCWCGGPTLPTGSGSRRPSATSSAWCRSLASPSTRTMCGPTGSSRPTSWPAEGMAGCGRLSTWLL